VSVEGPWALSSAYACTGADNKPFRGYYHPYPSEAANLKGIAGCFPLELTNQQRRKGKSNSLATRALANKWVKVIFALWQKRETYNEISHLWEKARYTLKARAA